MIPEMQNKKRAPSVLGNDGWETGAPLVLVNDGWESDAPLVLGK